MFLILIFVQSVAQDWAVEAMPTFMFLKEGSIVDKVVEARKEEPQQTIAKHIATSTASAEQYHYHYSIHYLHFALGLGSFICTSLYASRALPM